MEKSTINKPEFYDFSIEYNDIIKSSEQTVVVENQWEKDGDVFFKFSLYDNSYVPIKTLGSTTLIKSMYNYAKLE